MKTENYTSTNPKIMGPYSSLIKSLTEGYESIPNINGDKAAKILVADSIKSNGANPEDVLSFICSTMQNSSAPLDNAAWKALIDRAIKRGDLAGRNLKMCKPLKGNLSNEEYFNKVVSISGKNPDYLKSELTLDKVGWEEVVKNLIKNSGIAPVETKVEKTVETKVEKKVKRGRKVSIKTPGNKTKKTPVIKSSGKDPRCQAIVGINKETGEKKTWISMKSAEIDLGVTHGTISQVVSGKLKSAKGWVITKKGAETVKERPMEKNMVGCSRCKAVRLYGKAKNGKVIDRTFSSLTEAAKKMKIPHSSISKAITGTYKTAGGFHCEYAKSAIAEG